MEKNLKKNIYMSMATHSSILAWEIPWTEEPIVHGVTRVRHNLETRQEIYIYTHTYIFTHTHITESLGYTTETNTL